MNKEIWINYEKDLKERISNSKDESEIAKLSNQLKIANYLKDSKVVATHFGDDLDNKVSIATIEKFAKEIGALEEGETLEVERIPAGKIKEGVLNVDTGGHKGSKYDGETLIIDGNPEANIKSAAQEIRDKLGLYVPEQVIECADTMPTKISVFDTITGMSLQKFATAENVLKLAENKLLTKELTDEELEEYGLTQAHITQQQTVDKAVEEIAKYTTELSNGQKVVIALKFIKAGSIVAYESGIDYYASVDNHLDENKNIDGVTFAINSNPSKKLPDIIKIFGNELVEKYKGEDGASGVFVHPNGQMVVAGGPKNPEFKVDMTQEEIMNKIQELFKEYSKEECKKELLEKMKENKELNEKNIELDEKIEKSRELYKEAQLAAENREKSKGE